MIFMMTVLGWGGTALSAPTEDVITGATSVQLSGDLINALGSLQVQPGAVSGSSLNARGIARFPISGGAVDLGSVRAEIIHQGGLVLRTSGTTVELTDFVITTLENRPVLTGLVTVNDSLAFRAPLFELDLPAITPPLQPTAGILNLPDVRVILTAEAASTLNQAFGISTFVPGFNIGTARVRAILGSH
jgi:hypothetical protein